MIETEDQACYACGKKMRNHRIKDLYSCLDYLSNIIRTFDRIYNYSVYQCIKALKEENLAIHPAYLTEEVDSK